MSGMDAELIAEAIRLKLIDEAEADRFLRDTPPAKPLALVPKIPPPPENLTLIRYRGKIRRAQARFTKALISVGVIGRGKTKTRPDDSEEQTA